jgi:hypothetical protein
MFRMYALIYYYLDYLKINTYKGAIYKDGSRAYYNTLYIIFTSLTNYVLVGE